MRAYDICRSNAHLGAYAAVCVCVCVCARARVFECVLVCVYSCACVYSCVRVSTLVLVCRVHVRRIIQHVGSVVGACIRQPAHHAFWRRLFHGQRRDFLLPLRVWRNRAVLAKWNASARRFTCRVRGAGLEGGPVCCKGHALSFRCCSNPRRGGIPVSSGLARRLTFVFSEWWGYSHHRCGLWL